MGRVAALEVDVKNLQQQRRELEADVRERDEALRARASEVEGVVNSLAVLEGRLKASEREREDLAARCRGGAAESGRLCGLQDGRASRRPLGASDRTGCLSRAGVTP